MGQRQAAAPLTEMPLVSFSVNELARELLQTIRKDSESEVVRKNAAETAKSAGRTFDYIGNGPPFRAYMKSDRFILSPWASGGASLVIGLRALGTEPKTGRPDTRELRVSAFYELIDLARATLENRGVRFREDPDYAGEKNRSLDYITIEELIKLKMSRRLLASG